MKIILVCVGNLQEYIFHNIHNLLLFENTDITIITNRELSPIFHVYLQQHNNISIELSDDLDDLNFNITSKQDKTFRNGFWHLCSLRLIYIYSYMKKYNLQNCMHLENDVLCYENLDNLIQYFTENKLYATFDDNNRVIPGIIFIPTHEALKPIIDSYDSTLNDMQNLAKHDESIIIPLPIGNTVMSSHKCTQYYNQFNCIFDAAAIGQYLGGVDPRNASGNTEGFINETCIIKYNSYTFHWVKNKGLWRPYIMIDNGMIPIINLHIHSKSLQHFLADNPSELKYIKRLQTPNAKATIITAYYDFKNNRHQQSDYHQWITNFLPNVEAPVVIFTDEHSSEVLYRVCKTRMHKTKIIILPFEKFYTFKYMQHWQKDILRDHEKCFHTIEMYMIWNEKSMFVKKVIDDNPFDTEYFCWTDIGVIREESYIPYIKHYPNISESIKKDKVYLLNVEQSFHYTDFIDADRASERFRYRNIIGGGVIFAYKDSFIKWIDTFYEMLDSFIELDLFAGKDQSVMACVYAKNPHMIQLIRPQQSPFNYWFYLVYYLC